MKKKFIAIILCLFNVVILSIGCSKQIKEQDNTDVNTASNKEVTYEVSKEIEDLTGSFCRYCIKEDKFYTTIVQYDKEKRIGIIDGVYMSNVDGSEIKELSIPENFENQIGMSNFDFDDKQNLYYMNSYMENETEKKELIKLNSEGKEDARTGQSDSFDISDDKIKNGFTVTRDGMVIVYSRQELYVLDENLSLLETIKVKKGEIIETTLSKNGEVLCVQNEENGYAVTVLDIENKKLSETYDLHVSEYETILQGVGEYDFYYTDEYGIYGYDMKREISKKVFDYMASDVTSSEIMPLSNGDFVGEIEKDEDTFVTVIYTKKKYDYDSPCKSLTYATLNMDSEMKDAIYQFNNSQSDVEIVIKDYSAEADPIAKFNTDIIAGNIPDIFDLNELSVKQYVEKGLLEDLTPFYEKDEMIHEEDLVPSVLEAMKIDDKIYYVSNAFNVVSFVAKKSDVGNVTGWDYNDLNNVLSKKDEKAQFIYLNNKQEILHIMLWCQSTDFVDQQTGECYFDSEDFKNLLRICNERGVNDEDYEWTESEATLLRNGDILFRDISTEIEYYKETMAFFGEEVNIIGLPCADKQGNYIDFTSQIGISSKSEYKEEAWKFLRTLMTKEYQANTLSFFENLPTRQDCFDLRMEAEMATEDYINEMGREIHVRNYKDDMDGVVYEIKPFTEEQAKEYVDMVNRATKVVDYDENIMEIVQDEARHYFSGNKSLDDTVKVIQKRVTTYINESR